MKVSTPLRLEPELLDKVKLLSDERHWTISHTIREIVALFFNNELSANDG